MSTIENYAERKTEDAQEMLFPFAAIVETEQLAQEAERDRALEAQILKETGWRVCFRNLRADAEEEKCIRRCRPWSKRTKQIAKLLRWMTKWRKERRRQPELRLCTFDEQMAKIFEKCKADAQAARTVGAMEGGERAP